MHPLSPNTLTEILMTVRLMVSDFPHHCFSLKIWIQTLVVVVVVVDPLSNNVKKINDLRKTLALLEKRNWEIA